MMGKRKKAMSCQWSCNWALWLSLLSNGWEDLGGPWSKLRILQSTMQRGRSIDRTCFECKFSSWWIIIFFFYHIVTDVCCNTHRNLMKVFHFAWRRSMTTSSISSRWASESCLPHAGKTCIFHKWVKGNFLILPRKQRGWGLNPCQCPL